MKRCTTPLLLFALLSMCPGAAAQEISLKALTSVKAHRGSVAALAVRFDGKFVASGGGDGGLKIWNLMTGKPIIIRIGQDWGQDWGHPGNFWKKEPWMAPMVAAPMVA
jgi:WD40 repeat protein